MKKIFLLLLFLIPFALVAQENKNLSDNEFLESLCKGTNLKPAITVTTQQGNNISDEDAEFLDRLSKVKRPDYSQSWTSRTWENNLACIFITSIIEISVILLFIIILLIFYRKKFFNLYRIQGRATRKTFLFWWILSIPFFIFYFMFFFILGDLIFYLQENGMSPYWICLPLIISFILFYIPYICVQIRRLHDMNLSGSWYILCLLTNHTPLVIIKWIIFGCVPGTKGANKYGEIISTTNNETTKSESSPKIRNYIQRIKTKLSCKKIADKKAFVVSFLAGVIFGIIIMYAISNRYESYPSNGSIIIRIDKWTGATEMANTRSSHPQWHKIGEGL